MHIGNRSCHGSTQGIGEDLDLDLPQVVAGTAPVAQQIFDVVDVLLVWEEAAHGIAVVGGAVPTRQHQGCHHGVPGSADTEVANLNPVPIAGKIGALCFDYAAERTSSAVVVCDQVEARKERKGRGE